jgi:AIPR protein
MTPAAFLKYLNSQVKTYRKTYKLTEGKAFGMWLATEYLGLDAEDSFQAVSIDGGNDKDIDLFFVDDERERVMIGQLKFNAAGKYKAKKNELLGLIHTTDWLRDLEAVKREGKKELEIAATEYSEAMANGYPVEFVYAFCGPENREVADAARQFNVSEAGNVPARFCKLMAFDTLRTIHEESIDQSTRIDECEIEVSDYFTESGAYGEAVVTTLAGEELRKLYQAHGDQLFDRNVRLFLGARKGSVNAGIRDTLGSTTERKNFWAYNNGLTFVCDDFTGPKDGKLTLTNFSIVNGCQTTVGLAYADTNALDDVRVLVRFIRAEERYIDSVITFNNSQNPIRQWDLSSQDKLQKKLKKELAKLPKAFFYALRRGEFQKLSEKEKASFKRDGKFQQIPHDQNAQFIAAFRGLPAIGYKDKGKVFTVHRDEVFPPQLRAEEVVLVWQAGRAVKDLVKQELEQAIADENESRVAILKRGAPFFILAIVGLLLHERNGQTFLNKLKADVATSNKTAERLQKYAVIALEWHIDAMTELLAAGEEVATIVRSQEGWFKIKPKIQSKWKVYRLAQSIMEASLPKF